MQDDAQTAQDTLAVEEDETLEAADWRSDVEAAEPVCDVHGEGGSLVPAQSMPEPAQVANAVLHTSEGATQEVRK